MESNKEKVKKEKPEKEESEKKKNTRYILGVFLLNILIFALTLLLKMPIQLVMSLNLITPFLVWLALTFVVEFFKDDYDEESKRGLFLVIFFGFIISILTVLNGFLFNFNTPMIIFFFVNFLTLVSTFIIMRSDKFILMVGKYSLSTSSIKFLLTDSKLDMPQGSVQLCVEKETKKPEVLSQKDRFLHMLILGATGTGKTSQTIIPMLNQDMQNFECGITVIEPKGDLAEKVYAMGKHYGRNVLYFNPIHPDCPYFNPLRGKEEDVIEDMATTFKMLNPDSPQFFKDMNEQLIRKALLVLKRLMGDKANLIDLARLVQNTGGQGKKMVMEFAKIQPETEAEAKENVDTASWFLNDYFNEKSKTYEHCSGIRSQVAKITSNKYLRRVLNPPNGTGDIDFVKHLEGNGVIAISTAQGSLRDLGKFLGYFIILSLQSAVFKRPAPEDSRRPHFLYIDEFQTYSNPGFSDMLTQGRSYRVASHLATQNRALMAMGGGRDGKNFVDLVSTNARNLIIYPGGNVEDAEYYSKQFGEVMNSIKQKGVTRQKFNPFYGFQKMSYPSESVRFTEQKEARFSATDIIYRPFKEIIYVTIKDNSIQSPKVGQIEFIDKNLNKTLDDMVRDYNELQKAKFAKMESKSKDEIDAIFDSVDPDKSITSKYVHPSEDDVIINDDVNKNIIIPTKDANIKDEFDFMSDEVDSVI